MRKETYDKFRNDCPDLDFNQSDVITENFNIADPYEFMDLEEEEIEEGLNRLKINIKKLKKDSKEITELVYLVEFFEYYYQKTSNKEDLDVEFTIDINKLKYCKTLLAYLEADHVEYAGELLPFIDQMQDELVDYLEYDKNRVFYFPKEN